jgi:hypothetical protein
LSTRNLVFKAGPGAFDSIRRHGFSAERIGTLAGASGGAKWLVLSHLDRVLIGNVLPHFEAPLHLVATSIGAWRFACYAQPNPLAAIQRFEDAYIDQSYSETPDIHEITAKSREILNVAIGESGVTNILHHPVLRTHIMTVRARNIAASENRLLLAASLFVAASMNAISRSTLGLFYERALFFDARDLPPFFDVTGFPLQRIRIGPDNLEDAIVATGSIPLVLSGVRDITRAAPGVYRDGGVIDYHLDIPHSDSDKLALFPHFFDHIVPGWFDKKLTWRRPNPAHVDRTILICPAEEFVAKLPNAKIPDRTDFVNYAPAERVQIWRKVVAECEALGEELNDVLARNELESRLTPL